MQAEYRTVARLASGGMGAVDLCVRQHGRFRRLFAVKRLLPHLRRDEEMRRMFLDEARVAGLIRHPNVVPVLDVGEDEDGPFLAMDYVEGISVSRLIAAHTEPIPASICAHVVAQAARGLHAAHQLRGPGDEELELVHRDVSPQNILIGRDGLVRVTDFGIAKALGASARTSTGLLKGKVGYMAPEQLRFEPVDRRTDLFALGVVLCELVTGSRLYAGPDANAVAHRILDEPPPDLGEHRPDLPPTVVELGFRLMAKARENRPADAVEVAEILEAAFAEDGRAELAMYLEGRFADELEAHRSDVETRVAEVTSAPAPSTTRTASAARRRAVPVALATVAAVGLVVGVVAWPSASGSSSPFVIRSFSADWSTPNAIHWVWELEGPAEAFFAYEVHVAESPNALDTGEGVEIFERRRSPELGRFVLDHTRGEDRVLETITGGLDPDTDYFARLVVFDTAGGVVASTNVAVDRTTPEPAQEAVLFSEDAPPGVHPACVSVADRSPHGGALHATVDIQCDKPDELGCAGGRYATCFDFIRFTGLEVELGTRGLGGGVFADAFLEFALAIDPPAAGEQGHAWWTQIRILGPGMKLASHKPGPVFVADGEYRLYQIPLSRFGIDHTGLARSMTEVHVGSTWADGSVVRLDEVRIRW